jgi:hypothetical protein
MMGRRAAVGILVAASAVSLTELRDPQGNVVGPVIRGTATGTRMHVEPIPDQP